MAQLRMWNWHKLPAAELHGSAIRFTILPGVQSQEQSR